MAGDPITKFGFEPRQPEEDGVDDVAIGELAAQIITFETEPNAQCSQVSLELVIALVGKLRRLVKLSCHVKARMDF